MEEYNTFIIGFASAIIAIKMWDYFYSLGIIALSVKGCINDCIIIIAKNIQAVYEINNLKYLALEISNKSEKYIEFQKTMDARDLESMKNTTIRNYINSIPSKYNHLIPFSDWGSAMDYINAEIQKKGATKQ